MTSMQRASRMAPGTCRGLLIGGVVVAVMAAITSAAELKPATVAAFERYETATEAAIARDVSASGEFLRIRRNANADRLREIDAQLRRGEVAIDRLQVTNGGRRIEIPSGLVHHWIGAVFIPGARVDDTVALLQDYDTHATLFRPAVVQARTLERDGDRFRVFLRFYMKKVIAVTVNTESTAEFVRHGPDRLSSQIRSTRVAEVEEPGTPDEKEKPVGRDGGFLWRLNTYWRFLQRDGGTYVECESITLTRGIPAGLGWIIKPFVTGIPRESLTFTLEGTRRALLARAQP
jgi:hypothetical protein